MTLTEMVVAVAVLIVLMLGFGQILGKSQEVVLSAERQMRMNASAAAIEQVLRQSVARISKQGFMSIGKDASGRPRLVATAAGVSRSVPSGTMSVGTLLAIGVQNKTRSALTQEYVLWHAPYVLSMAGGGSDVDAQDLTSLIRMTPAQARTKTFLMGYSTYDRGFANPFAIPAASLAGISDLWQVLSTKCRDLSIAWTDGTAGAGGLNWYDATNDGDPAHIVYGTYHALWTNTNQSNWPRAVKISFTLIDKTAKGVQERDYEVICPIGL